MIARKVDQPTLESQNQVISVHTVHDITEHKNTYHYRSRLQTAIEKLH